MELLQLRYFYESAKCGSFAKTAKKYDVPLTAVSASIRRLESELDCKLFDRSANRIDLNDNGRRLQQSLCVVFDELEGAMGDLSAQETENRQIRVLVRGMRRNITNAILEFKAQYPDSVFQICFDFGETQLQNYDVIIDEASALYGEYQRFEFFSTRLRVKCGRQHPLLGKPVEMKQLCDANFISMGEESNLHKVLLEACGQAGFTPKIAVVCNDLECYEKLIAGGIGIAVGREKSLSPDIACLDVRDFDQRYTLYCYYRQSACSGMVKRFVDHLQSHIARQNA